MTDESLPELDRLTELLADRALFGLDEVEQRELDGLLAAAKDIDQDSLERVAAMAQLATVGTVESLPAELAQTLSVQAEQALAMTVKPTGQIQLKSPATTFPRRELLAWFAAAAAVTFAWFGLRQKSSSSSLSPAELRAELLSTVGTSSDELTQVAWSLGDDPASTNASGDVVWHNGRQQGVMKFSNLAANDPTVSQYQLWIFDAEQDDKFPIDGGVFDVSAGAKEIFVEIDAKLPVVKPTLFAVTIEKPGGVVVSSRERLPLLAKVE